MENIGMLIDYEWCSGCHSCEVACQMEHGLPVGQTGISVHTVGPWEIAEDNWQYTHLALPTKQCTGCVTRRAKGKLASCAHHCQSKCLQVGPLEDLMAELSNKPSQALFFIQQL
ncbi:MULTISPECIES: oxidoreductase [Gordonibacter]|uniref:Oxidoreductase n=1 Tax=Gordonibacter faecis TaxID=3047475 RepID=A0ABT7DJK2_9ACTN|nr:MULTISPECIES: oxidoreductase [unclassified Gordonibacter]MDJ1649705.1 oxidoreductase [Gordonibacter sp. KGMB12511]HIW76508.1 oxidoreductase [Candidatus Gordonibacter avicola]